MQGVRLMQPYNKTVTTTKPLTLKEREKADARVFIQRATDFNLTPDEINRASVEFGLSENAYVQNWVERKGVTAYSDTREAKPVSTIETPGERFSSSRETAERGLPSITSDDMIKNVRKSIDARQASIVGDSLANKLPRMTSFQESQEVSSIDVGARPRSQEEFVSHASAAFPGLPLESIKGTGAYGGLESKKNLLAAEISKNAEKRAISKVGVDKKLNWLKLYINAQKLSSDLTTGANKAAAEYNKQAHDYDIEYSVDKYGNSIKNEAYDPEYANELRTLATRVMDNPSNFRMQALSIIEGQPELKKMLGSGGVFPLETKKTVPKRGTQRKTSAKKHTVVPKHKDYDVVVQGNVMKASEAANMLAKKRSITVDAAWKLLDAHKNK